MTNTLTGLTTMGTVISESSSKDAQLFQQPMPMSNSSDAILLDLFGALRTISLSGKFVNGDGGLTNAQFIAELDALINGEQTTKQYHSDKSGQTYNVLVQTVNWTVGEAGVNFVDYSITLTEGSL